MNSEKVTYTIYRAYGNLVHVHFQTALYKSQPLYREHITLESGLLHHNTPYIYEDIHTTLNIPQIYIS